MCNRVRRCFKGDLAAHHATSVTEETRRTRPEEPKPIDELCLARIESLSSARLILSIGS